MLLAIEFFDLQKYLPKINTDLLGDVRLTSDVSGMQILKTKWIRQPTPLPLEIYLTGLLNCYLLIQGFSESFPRVNGVIATDFDFPDTGLFHRAYYFLEKNYFVVGYPDYSVQLATRSGNFGMLVWIKDSKTQLQDLLNRLVTTMI